VSAPAGFWQRYAAWSLDAALVAILITPFLSAGIAQDVRALDAAFSNWLVTFYTRLAAQMDASGLPPLSLLADATLRQDLAAIQRALLQLVGPPALAFAMVSGLYHVASDTSRWQGSLGKRALRLQVGDREGRRIGIARAIGRHLAGAASWLTLNVGHAMAALAPRHRALHDVLSGTRVLGQDVRLPGWARGWIAVQALAGLAGSAWLVAHLVQLVHAALEQALGA
jgi:uncharacterized RDD family membrane protein YckC